MTHLQLDHASYISSPRYRRELHASLRRLITSEPHAISQMAVVHEADNSCCRRQAWPLTYASLLGSLNADGERVLGVAL